MRTDIRIVRSDDWAGMYLDDELVAENHTLKLDDVLEKLEWQNVGTVSFLTVDDAWMEEQGSLPQNLYDIPEEMLSE